VKWRLVTPASPDRSELPVTVVRSRSQRHAVWMPYIEDLNDERKQALGQFFEHGEILYAEDWYPPLA